MFDRLLFPTDGSRGSEAVLEHVLDIAEMHGAALHLLHVAPPEPERRPQPDDEATSRRATEGEKFVDDAAARASQTDVETITEVVHGEPYQEIINYGETNDIDLIVMPTHGRSGLSRLLLGSTTERVVRRSDVPVLTVRPDEQSALSYPYEHILTPTDGSPCANAAVTLGSELAVATEADIHGLSVVNVAYFGADVRGPVLVEEFEERAERAVSEAIDIATETGVANVTDAVERDVSIHQGVLSYIDDHDIDLVVMGTHGHTGFDRYMLGSVAEKLLRTSPVPVLTVREPKREE
ncbi:universal stress protein [Haloferax mediterranei ATCC 33500]|uniref:Universal stress protein n=1 Tax=Haloferax mediterranei (strain ATCC 33500 / DSM 1411 / JCM 8866 / NBRC 14739 / NCIMB 2177 / R-4) TaxID=523841 RepID=I3R6M7_HALMT|nr:universal stress protein [Haloferax mediterranei]AFK19887.1 universal stress protein UspA-like protein [Haloferax mediterranei ATCC 33500]AHZ23266.1 universal stress protein UspA [Haloferax mediterranei ATCC 33500]ELZ99431.1 universal stress protein UspA-like protein [Haloferax mediterranei ATCC 33500]MDX5987364.1 universal stress protein [Haloferax mediterranei ATCC 33500]QCQ73872.1 universal stress protein [Haloferax mediterranei ATCC 33500]